jgi:hypothetical protein
MCVATVGTDDVDALLRQVRAQLAQLLLRDVDLLQRAGDVVERQIAPLLALRDQGPKLVQFMDRRLVRQQNLIVDRSAPLRCLCPSRPFALPRFPGPREDRVRD